jgi:hypothetical protein
MATLEAAFFFTYERKEGSMSVVFSGRREVVAASRVVFEALVDGKDIWCSVSADALDDQFGNQGRFHADLLRTFEANRVVIEGAATRVLERSGARSVELETADFH